jgi:2-polyprenyl-6-methoxyphenol hydroxylase-like FAD-dependent oxidoreductase/pimeloyl-ACP methyl ester carboxylesterase
MTPVIDTPVLIVGGGPVGLALALDLAWRGKRSTLVEEQPGTATVLLAKAGTINERSMEFCRRWGIADRVAKLGFPDDFPRDTVYCTALNGKFIGRDPMPSARDRKTPPGGPEMLRKAPQHVFDPLLEQAVKERGMTDIRYDCRFESMVQDADGVTTTFRHVDTGEVRSIRSRYLVGADGAGSAVRRALAIPFEGQLLSYSVSAMVRVENLARYHPFGNGERFMFIGPNGTWANLTAVDGRALWRFTLIGSDERVDLDTLDMTDAVRRAFGRNDIEFEIVRYMPWRRSQMIAQRYRVGRAFLAGDAAHTTSPTGGHGLNTGLGDSVDLGWMLNAALEGWGGDRLLDAYEAERRPVAIRNSSASTRNFNVWTGGADYSNVLDEGPAADAARRKIGEQMSASLHQEWHSQGIGMGYRYEGSPVIVPDGAPATPDEADQYISVARPGHHAPHAWLQDGRSTLDLFGHGFVMLRFGTVPADVTAIVEMAAEHSLPLTVIDINDESIARLYERSLVLVRPDAHVCWRGDRLPEDVGSLLDIVRGAPAQSGARPSAPASHPAARHSNWQVTVETFSDAQSRPADEPALVLAELESKSTRIETRGGTGKVVWRRWGQGPAVILFHGGGGSWRHWVRNIPVLMKQYTLWIPDLPGYGESDLPAAPLSFDTVCDALQAGLDEILPGDTPFNLIGFSFGCHVAAKFAQRVESRVSHMILVGANFVSDMSNSRFGGLVNWRKMSGAEERLAAMHSNMQIMMIADPGRIDDLALHIYSSDLETQRLKPIHMQGKKALTEELERVSPQVRVSGVSGTEDQVFAHIMEQQEEALAALRPGAGFHKLDGASHWVMYEAADGFNAKLLELLAD